MNSYVLSIDAGTTGITVIVINQNLSICKKYYKEFTQIYPQPGWVEHDPKEIWESTLELILSAFKDFSIKHFISIGITNQRETSIIWNRHTGIPIYNAIVWQCSRTEKICSELIDAGHEAIIKDKTGLMISSYFSGSKIKWLLDNVPSARKDSNTDQLIFGTIDTWLIWNLTSGNVHATDYTNASRTMIFNIDNKEWDKDLLLMLDIPQNILPEVKTSIGYFGKTDKKILKNEIPITGVAGDQQASLFGHSCFNQGDTKCTYGTGCFLMTNTGNKRIDSSTGLITTIACNLDGSPSYALEGSVFIGGAVIQWLRDELNILANASDSEKIALQVKSSEGVIIVPAFTGLGAPYWNMNAKGLITGISRGTNRSHIIRAALESIAYQVSDLSFSISKDLNRDINHLKVDGGASANNFLMQFQSNILNTEIHRPRNIESTSLGAGLLSGLGSKLWDNPFEIIKDQQNSRIFKSNISDQRRLEYLQKWKNAINKVQMN